MQKLRLIYRCVLEEGPDGREARVPAASCVAAHFLYMGEEQAHEIGVDVGDLQCRRRFLQLFSRVAQEQAERVPIADDRVRAGLQLRAEPLREEPLQVWCESMRLHRAPPFWESLAARDRSARADASCSSSGTASIYQYVCSGFAWQR